jgi:formamidopyrimidine-DNA glycosylase
MPELPEVETVRRGLALRLEGRRFAKVEQRRPDLRKPFPWRMKQRLEGHRVERVGRRAKYLLLDLDSGETLLAHLGMAGRMVIVDPGQAMPRDPHDHVVFTLEDGTELRFNDARRFGLMDLAPKSEIDAHPLLKDLGPEPLGNAFSGPVLEARLRGKETPLKSALLDQRVVAGLGNIYVSESLFHARLSPRRLAGTVKRERAEALATAIKHVLERAIAAGGSSIRDYVQTSGELGYFQHEWAVYGRAGEKCPGCDCKLGIRQIVQGGRSTFYCAKRQR